MSKLTKKEKIIQEKLDPNLSYSVDEAMEILQSVKSEKFDESVDISVKLGVDPNKSDQNVRGAVTLPNSLGKKPSLSVLNNAPLGVIVAPSVLRYVRGVDSFNILFTVIPFDFIPIIFSGEILYCIIKCGYSELMSNETIQLCIPTNGSFTYAPGYFSSFILSSFGGITILSLRKKL